MQEAVPLGQGAMAAVLGMDAEPVNHILSQVEGMVSIANYNCPGQLVISGEKGAVAAAAADLKKAGARVVPLAISVPSHCRLMQPAAEGLRPHLAACDWKEPLIPVISNVNARDNGAAHFADLLTSQLYMPVLWEQSVRFMLNQVDYLVEVGPGSSLSGLIKKIDRSRLLGQVDDVSSLQKLVEKVKSL